MSLLPFTSTRPTSVVPFTNPLGMELDTLDPMGSWGLMDPIQRQLYNDPLVRRTMQNAQAIQEPIKPILYADLLDFGDRYEIHADLPGVPKSDLDVTIANGTITIKGERKKRFEDDDVWGNHRIERSYGKVSRTMTLPFDCDATSAECNFEMGVLNVKFPKVTGTSSTAKKLLIK
jgi:HSP20 family molecular chaperone IbpA